jgi:hypothetical protein
MQKEEEDEEEEDEEECKVKVKVKVKVSPITSPKGKGLLPSSRASSVRLIG